MRARPSEPKPGCVSETFSLNRRRFLKGAGLLGLSLLQLRLAVPRSLAAPPAGQRAGSAYGDWRDVYREQWTWDRIVKGAHHAINCNSACPFNLYVKDGIVWREEQNTIMDATNPSLPDYNPRGCQKGICYSDLMYAPNRLKYPLRRAGRRGEGRWRRVSWKEALGEIAEKIIDISIEDGPECVVYDSGTANAGYGSPTGGEMRFFELQGATQLDGWAAVGDMPLGVLMTWGLFNVDSTMDDYFNADLVYLWLANPSYTRIPDAHFLWEARYRGTKFVSIAPDYNATTMHCDRWVNLRLGTDAALALAMAEVIVSENLYKADFVKEQTDLPLLVRDDNGHFLRQSDLEKGGKDNVFYLWDQRRGRAVPSPGSEGLGRRSKLDLGKLDPALKGRFTVTLAGGSKVVVRPVFELLRRRLKNYSPAKASNLCDVGEETIRSLAREFAGAKAVTIFASWGSMKHHHSDLFQRSMILLLALTGNVGRRGTGMRIGAWYMLSSIEWIMSGVKPTWIQKILMALFKPTVRELIGYFRDYERDKMYMPALLFLYQHAGLKHVIDRQNYHDPNPGVPLKKAVREAIENGSMPMYPKAGKKPRMYVHTRVNPLRRWPSPQVVEKTLWPKLELIVAVNTKMSTTALKSDLLLPGCGYYERRGIKYAQSYVPYYMVGDKAVDELGESKSEWEIFGLLARELQRRARDRGVSKIRGVHGNDYDLSRIYEQWSHQRRFRPEDDLEYYEIATGESPETGHMPWSKAVKQGAIPIKDIGPFRTHTNICSDYEPGKTVYPCQWFVEQKQPWPTLTGRMQFYIDHEWFLSAGEELPVHKEPPKAGGDYPLRLTGGHTRWSIHSTWRDQKHMLQLQRGEPAVYIGSLDAKARRIHDHDRVRVFNDVGSCELVAKISPALQPGEVIIYHAWEPFQFKDWRSNQEPVPSPWKALHMAKYGQLHYRFLYGGPHHAPRATTVEVARV